MKNINRIHIIGNLGNDPVLRETKKGTKVVHFPVGTSHRTKQPGSDEFSEETQLHDVVVWGNFAETCNRSLKKGSGVYVEGSVRTRLYETKEGETRLAYEVHSSDVVFLDKKKIEQRMAS